MRPRLEDFQVLSDEAESRGMPNWMADYLWERLRWLGIDEDTAADHAIEIEEYIRYSLELRAAHGQI
jgi:hypothetical protein